MSAIGYHIDLPLRMEIVTVGFKSALHSHCFSSVYHIRLSSLLPLAQGCVRADAAK